MKINYYDEMLDENKEESGLTKSEYNSRMGDLRMMELGGKVSSIVGTEDED